jgi:hypothetical protein
VIPRPITGGCVYAHRGGVCSGRRRASREATEEGRPLFRATNNGRGRADAGTRTPDPHFTKVVLYQLSYVGATMRPLPAAKIVARGWAPGRTACLKALPELVAVR